MKLLKRIQEFAAFTKNEQKVFLFLSIVFLAGVSIKVYKAYVVTDPVRHFDYSASDKEFEERSRRLSTLPRDGEQHTGATRSRAENPQKRVNINAASKKDLISLPGIGAGLADEILRYRQEHGAFTSVDELRKVRGIGTKKFEKLLPYVDIK